MEHLSEQASQRLAKIADFANHIHSQNKDGHDFDHISRVVALANQILETEATANRELVLATCYLHDTYDAKLFDNVAAQKAVVADFLTSLKFDESFQTELFDIIDHMSFSANLTEHQSLSLNGQIVQDADRLDAMGAWGIVRALEYGWQHGRVLYDPAIAPQNYRNKADYHQSKQSTTLNHFSEKLFLLKNQLNTTEGKCLGAARDAIMHDFVTAIKSEYADSHRES